MAAATTSLPERIGGVRNWDYRFCWLRDATFTLQSLVSAGYIDEAKAWRKWLLRAVAGDPADLQIMYGPAGERRLTEVELPWLDGYEGSKPVRIGNEASAQLQLDVYGEMIDALYEAHLHGLEPEMAAFGLQVKLLEFLEDGWRQPDDGLWEIRGTRRHFTHSKVMCWVAFDRAIKLAEEVGAEGDMVKRFRAVRQEIHDEVLAKGFDEELGSFVQSYGSRSLDASLLIIPIVGFLPPEDPRVVGTVEAIQRHLTTDGMVQRYTEVGEEVDGLPAGEGSFFLCSFWLADCLVLLGRMDEARELFERLARVAHRPRPALRGVRHAGAAPARQLPASLLPRGARQHGAEPRGSGPRAPATPGPAAQVTDCFSGARNGVPAGARHAPGRLKPAWRAVRAIPAR